MEPDRLPRKLAAILYADVAGYARLTGKDEEGTHRRLSEYLDRLSGVIEAHRGRVVHYAGDAILADFSTVTDALGCALSIQDELSVQNQDLPDDLKVQFRIGVNLGEVIVDRDDIYGEGVNVAARLETLADPGGVCISEAVRSAIGNKLPVAYEFMGERQVKNIKDAVRAYQVRIRPVEGLPTMAPPALERKTPDRPSIAVLPFSNMSGDPEQEYFGDGITEDIITALSKVSSMMVIARNSTFVYKGRSVDVRQVARDLNVRYVLEGSVRKAGDRVRVTAQLIDAESGAHVWAERYDRTLADILAVQDEITLIVVTELQVKLTEGEQARLRSSAASNVEAWTHWSEGLSYYRRGPVTKDTIGRVRACWEKALALDPESATFNALLGFIHYVDARFSWWDEREIALEKGRAYVDRALKLDPADADAHTASSLLLLLRQHHDEAVAHARRAVELAPGSADAAAFACFVLALSGHPGEAVTQIERAMTLSPIYPPYYLGHLGQAYRLSGRLDDAIVAFKAYGERSRGFGLTDLVLIYQQQGRHEDARQVAKELIVARPDFTVDSWVKTQFRRDTAQLETEIAALRVAGLPMN